MTQQINEVAAKLNDQSPIPRTNMMEGDSAPTSDPLAASLPQQLINKCKIFKATTKKEVLSKLNKIIPQFPGPLPCISHPKFAYMCGPLLPHAAPGHVHTQDCAVL